MTSAVNPLLRKPYRADRWVRQTAGNPRRRHHDPALLELLAFEEVRQARVGHMVATLRQAGRQHFLVGERSEAGQRVRGIFSLSQIARQLGIAIQTSEIARTSPKLRRCSTVSSFFPFGGSTKTIACGKTKND